MESDIDSIELLLAEARSLRNLAKINCRLTPEILTCIFKELQNQWAPTREVWRPSNEERGLPRWAVEKLRKPDRFRSGWMTVTHVCSYWRKVRRRSSMEVGWFEN